MEDIIVCEGLNKYYSGVHALKDLSLKIKKDSVVGLIGDNGAGRRATRIGQNKAKE